MIKKLMIILGILFTTQVTALPKKKNMIKVMMHMIIVINSLISIEAGASYV